MSTRFTRRAALTLGAAATGSPPEMRRFETSMYQSAYSSHRNERTWLE